MEKSPYFGEYCEKKYSMNSSGQTNKIQPILPSSTDKLLLKKIVFVNRCLPRSFTVLLPDSVQDTVPKAMKAEFAGPFHRFLNLLYGAQKLLLLRLALHPEKLLLFLVHVLIVITGVTTKWNRKIGFYGKILSGSSGYM